jgi:sugar O-acyltransferase (sialic acid O-acetyltransferase NeuD family)
MSGTSILLVGAGGHARACIDVIEAEGRFSVGGLVGLPDQVGTSVLGYPVLGTDSDLPFLLASHAHALVTVGQIETPDHRIRLFSALERCSYALPSIVSPRAHVSRHAVVAAGTIIMHGAIVNAGAIVGRNCILNSQSLVEHDAVIADHCHISTAAVVNGGAHIAVGTFLGSNSCVREGLSVGARCVIGMGQRIVKNCAAEARFPAAVDLP